MSTSLSGLSTNFFPSAQNGFSTTLAATISSGAATVPLNSVAGYSNGQIVVFVVDPTDVTKKQTFTGVIDTAGVQVTSVVWTAGTNQSHTGGSTVVDYATATHISMITKGLTTNLVDQDGTMKAGAVDNAAALASSVVTTAKILDANVTSAKLAADISPAKFANPYKFRAFRNTSSQAAAQGFVKIQFNGETYDTGSNFDSATNFRFVAPIAGFYFFTAAANLSTSTNDDYSIALYKNGSIVSSGAFLHSATGTTQLDPVVSDVLQLSATDYIEVFAYTSNAGGQNVVNGTEKTYFSGFLLSST